VEAGDGLATQRIDSAYRLRIVDAILSGTHESGSSHYELLRAFVDTETLHRVDIELNRRHYRTHEFGDSVFVERDAGISRYDRGAELTRAQRNALA
jgi:S-adenosylmethionine:tRNA ribosyltransferase-isomerase